MAGTSLPRKSPCKGAVPGSSGGAIGLSLLALSLCSDESAPSASQGAPRLAGQKQKVGSGQERVSPSGFGGSGAADILSPASSLLNSEMIMLVFEGPQSAVPL